MFHQLRFWVDIKNVVAAEQDCMDLGGEVTAGMQT